MKIIVNTYLLWGMWQDIKERQIGNLYLIVGAVGGLIICLLKIWIAGFIFEEWVAALIPGVFLLISAKVWKEKIGLGDGLLLLVLGNFFRIGELWLILQVAAVLLIIFSILLLSSKKASKDCQIPFLPFLWIAHTLLWGLHYV